MGDFFVTWGLVSLACGCAWAIGHKIGYANGKADAWKEYFKKATGQTND